MMIIKGHYNDDGYNNNNFSDNDNTNIIINKMNVYREK